MEEAIQRFRSRRRLDNDRSLLFSRYLFLGGIDSSTRMFTGTTGMDDADLKSATPADMLGIQANDVIVRSGNSSRFYNPNRPENWEVDFAGVAAGFL